MSALPQFFEALGDPTRFELVSRLSVRGPQSTLRLVEGLSISRQAATRHLEVLENVGIVKSSRQGREVLRELNPEGFSPAIDWLSARAAAWDEKLDALKRLLEG